MNSPLRWTPTEARRSWKPAEFDRSSEVLGETKSDTGKLYRSDEGHAEGRLPPVLLGEWHLPFPLLSAFWQIHYITISHLYSGTLSLCTKHKRPVDNIFQDKISDVARPLLSLKLSSLFPFLSLLAHPSKFSLPHGTHLNSSESKEIRERKREIETERIKPWLHCEQVQQCDICGWVKPPRWSYRHPQTSTWLNMNCGPPSASILTYLMNSSTRILLFSFFFFIFPPHPPAKSCPLLLPDCLGKMYQRVTAFIKNWSYLRSVANILIFGC